MYKWLTEITAVQIKLLTVLGNKSHLETALGREEYRAGHCCDHAWLNSALTGKPTVCQVAAISDFNIKKLKPHSVEALG